jgi:hypothetical protein
MHNRRWRKVGVFRCFPGLSAPKAYVDTPERWNLTTQRQHGQWVAASHTWPNTLSLTRIIYAS